MFGRLLLLFILIPIAEMYLLFWVAGKTSPLATVLLVLFTAVLGAALARIQGWQTFAKIQTSLSAGKVPGAELMDAGMILVASALLLTPGLITDLFGFSLLAPPIRALYRRFITSRMKGHFKVQTFGNMSNQGAPRSRPNDDQVIDSYVVGSEHDPNIK